MSRQVPALGDFDDTGGPFSCLFAALKRTTRGPFDTVRSRLYCEPSPQEGTLIFD